MGETSLRWMTPFGRTGLYPEAHEITLIRAMRLVAIRTLAKFIMRKTTALDKLFRLAMARITNPGLLPSYKSINVRGMGVMTFNTGIYRVSRDKMAVPLIKARHCLGVTLHAKTRTFSFNLA
jgi:hypothetical protein